MARIAGDDGLIADEVGDWAKQKHEYLKRYVAISHGVRKRFTHKAGATYVDLFCATGRSKIKDTDQWIDGSPIAAWKKSVKSGSPFTEMYINDLDAECVKACEQRLLRLGAPVKAMNLSAVDASAQYARMVNPHGLHLAFVDPYSLKALDFEIIKNLTSLKRIDAVVHISSMDLQRNFALNVKGGDDAFDRFAPDWRNHIDMEGASSILRMRFIEYWRELVVGLDKWTSAQYKDIRGSRQQPLYWLALLANNDLAHKFWEIASNPEGQGDLFR